MGLGAGALKVSGGPNAMSREEVSMATLEAGTPQERPLTGTVTLNEIQWRNLPKRILSWENTYETTKQGGRRGSKNPRWFARRQKLIRYDQQAKLQCNATLAKEHTRSASIPRGLSRRSRTGMGEDRWPTRSSITLLKWDVATWKKIHAWPGIEPCAFAMTGCSALSIELIKPSGEQAIVRSLYTHSIGENDMNWVCIVKCLYQRCLSTRCVTH